ncbi:MAG: O-phosphoseryl-tRNA(Sec) selenium transferase [Candidatus Thorarchaeota archaeon]|nr:O-phosphoseryl-tRNA(Sec) selenium transferase [Candidatus Thorarchaeota archaeon]
MGADERLKAVLPPSIAARGEITLDAFLAPIRDVLNRRVFPDDSLSDEQLDILLKLLSSMDTDKDPEAARVGEREARIASPFVGMLSSGFNHGIGRSGHVTAAQPKAPGASLMQQVASSVALDAIRKLGLGSVKGGFISPLSTGMSIALTLAALRRTQGIRTVLYPRVDHESPKRGIAMAGLKEMEIPTILEGEAVCADLSALTKAIKDNKAVAILATTTFFPPRESDPVKEIARLCQDASIPFVINNAYGVQSNEVMKAISSAIDAGRVDAIVQSSDKNFLTPVGASIVVSPHQESIEAISETYAGRATAAPVVQTLASLLSLGFSRYKALQEEQKANKKYLECRLDEIAEEVSQRVLSVENPVALAMTMDGLDVREIGGRLYNMRVTGPRAVEMGAYGSCIDDYPHSYIVMNSAIGATKSDVEKATTKLYKEVKGLLSEA